MSTSKFLNINKMSEEQTLTPSTLLSCNIKFLPPKNFSHPSVRKYVQLQEKKQTKIYCATYISTLMVDGWKRLHTLWSGFYSLNLLRCYIVQPDCNGFYTPENTWLGSLIILDRLIYLYTLKKLLTSIMEVRKSQSRWAGEKQNHYCWSPCGGDSRIDSFI